MNQVARRLLGAAVDGAISVSSLEGMAGAAACQRWLGASADSALNSLLISGNSSSIGIVSPGQRLYGPRVTLNTETLGGEPDFGSRTPDTIAVARQPFTVAGEPCAPLGSVLRQLAPGHVAAASSLCRPSSRLMVDLYDKNPLGGLKLRAAGVDVLEALHAAGADVTVCPDVAAAKVPPSKALQSSQEVLMVAPTAFVFNEEAAQDNVFMHHNKGGNPTAKVLGEYAGLIAEIRDRAGVKVHLFEHSHEHGTPDACFPNNWFSTHPAEEVETGDGSGTLVLYPLKCTNRQRERRAEIVEYLKSLGRYGRVVDMTTTEKDGHFFEGTGTLVIDRVARIAYVAISERSHADVARKWADTMGYELVLFHSSDMGKPVYHTNVMMAVGTGVAVVCSESVKDSKERQQLMDALERRHEVVDITSKQMEALCGNVLELRNRWSLPVMAMSTQAYDAFTEEQRDAILRHVADIHHAPIDTLEFLGGGGVRCTLGEVFPAAHA